MKLAAEQCARGMTDSCISEGGFCPGEGKAGKPHSVKGASFLA